MGAAIAANLLKAGYGLRVYNRTAAKAAPLVDKGATLASKPAEVAQPGGIVLTMVADDRALEDLCLTSGSFVERLGSGGIHISMSTIAPATAERLAEHHAKFGVTYLASPVFGRPEAAAAAKLWICVSGAAAAKEKAKPIHAAIGQGVFDFGEGVASANVVKLCGNFLIASAIESLAESLTLAEKNGVDKKAVADMLGKTILACPVYQGYSKQIAEERFEPAGFRSGPRTERHHACPAGRHREIDAHACGKPVARPLACFGCQRPRESRLDCYRAECRRRCGIEKRRNQE